MGDGYFDSHVKIMDKVSVLTLCIYTFVISGLIFINCFFVNPAFRRFGKVTAVSVTVTISVMIISIIACLYAINKKYNWVRYVATFAMILMIGFFSFQSMFDFFAILYIPTFLAIFYYDYKFVIASNVLSIVVQQIGTYFYNVMYAEYDYGVELAVLKKIVSKKYIEVIDLVALFGIGLLSAWLSYTMKKNTQEKFSIETERAEVQYDIKVASVLQQNMLTNEFPEEKEYDVYASMKPTRGVGGDFYDFFKIDRKHAAMIIADVSGKGIQASIYMSLSKALLKVYSLGGNSVDKIAEKTNAYLKSTKGMKMFVTAWIGILDMEKGMLFYTNAGHNPPCIMRASGQYEFLKSRVDFVLGGKAHIRYFENQVRFMPGDKIFLYTDGVTEAKSESGEFYSEARMLEELNKCTDMNPRNTIEFLNERLREYQGESEQYDDITMLCFSFNEFVHMVEEKYHSFKADKHCFNDVIAYISEETQKTGCSPAISQNIEIAASEVLANICSYAYDGENGMLEVLVKKEENKVLVIFRDNGKQYNPIENDRPDTTLPLHERKRGGLGIHIIKKLMTDVQYKYENGMNVLTLIQLL